MMSYIIMLILGACGIIILIHFLDWLFFSHFIVKGKASKIICSHLKDLINGQWTKRSKPIFVMGEFDGKHKGREAVYKITKVPLPYEPDEVYLLLRPNISWVQNAPSPKMIFNCASKHPKVTENTYLKGGWLVYKPELSRKIPSAEEFYMDKERLIQALEELTQAAEIVEKEEK